MAVLESMEKIERFFSFSLNDMQKRALDAVMKCEDVLVCARTGRGKSVCYQALPIAFGSPSVVLVISAYHCLQDAL